MPDRNALARIGNVKFGIDSTDRHHLNSYLGMATLDSNFGFSSAIDSRSFFVVIASRRLEFAAVCLAHKKSEALG